MHDDALVTWINDGAKIELTGDAAVAKRVRDFSARFIAAISPVGDLGPTEEAHEAAVARNVYVIHRELCALGDEEYNAVWSTLSAPVRRALKAYIEAGKP